MNHAAHLEAHASPGGRELVCDDQLCRASLGWLRLALAAPDLDRPDVLPVDWLGRRVVATATPVTHLRSDELTTYLGEMSWYLCGDLAWRPDRVTAQFREHLELARARAYFLAKYVVLCVYVAPEHRTEPDSVEGRVTPSFVFEVDVLLSEMDLVLSRLARATVRAIDVGDDLAPARARVLAHARRTEEPTFVTFRAEFEAELRAAPADWRIYAAFVPENRRPTPLAVLAARDATLIASAPTSWADAVTPAADNDPLPTTVDAALSFVFDSIARAVCSRDPDRPGLFVLRFASTWFFVREGVWHPCDSLLRAFRELRRAHPDRIYVGHEPDPALIAPRADLSLLDPLFET